MRVSMDESKDENAIIRTKPPIKKHFRIWYRRIPCCARRAILSSQMCTYVGYTTESVLTTGYASGDTIDKSVAFRRCGNFLYRDRRKLIPIGDFNLYDPATKRTSLINFLVPIREYPFVDGYLRTRSGRPRIYHDEQTLNPRKIGFLIGDGNEMLNAQKLSGFIVGGTVEQSNYFLILLQQKN